MNKEAIDKNPVGDYSKQYPDTKALLEKIKTLNKIIGKIISTSKNKGV